MVKVPKGYRSDNVEDRRSRRPSTARPTGGRVSTGGGSMSDLLGGMLGAPLDIEGFCRSVPGDMAQQAYALSVMGMKLDTQREAQYLGAVAQGLGLDGRTCNAVHDQLGAQIFR